MIDRMVLARRQYEDGSTLTSTASYSYSYPGAPNGQMTQQVTVETVKDGAGNVLANTTHTYWGSAYDALFNSGIAYNNCKEGREQSTQYGSRVLKTSAGVWQNLSPVVWCPSFSGIFCSQNNGNGYPESNPVLVSETTTLNDTSQQSEVQYAYDSYADRRTATKAITTPGL